MTGFIFVNTPRSGRYLILAGGCDSTCTGAETAVSSTCSDGQSVTSSWQVNSSCQLNSRSQREAEEAAAKRAHAEQMRRRDLSYLWQAPAPRRLHSWPGGASVRFTRFIPGWSARRFRSRTSAPPKVKQARASRPLARASRRIEFSGRSWYARRR